MNSLQKFVMKELEGTIKYRDKLFYVGPLYHLIFPNLKKLIFMDVDLAITINIKELFRQFQVEIKSYCLSKYSLKPFMI